MRYVMAKEVEGGDRGRGDARPFRSSAILNYSKSSPRLASLLPLPFGRGAGEIKTREKV